MEIGRVSGQHSMSGSIHTGNLEAYKLSDSVLNMLRQTHPTLQILGTMDETTYNNITKSGNNYQLAAAGTSIVDSYSETNQDNFYQMYNGGDVKVGQAFTTPSTLPANSPLKTVKFYLKRSLNPTGNATAVLYAATGTVGTNAVPTGAALATSNTFDVSTLNTSFALITFTFASPYNLQPSTDYCISIEFSGGSVGNTCDVGIDSSSPTHAGNLYHYIASYSALSTQDVCFYAYSDPLKGNILSNAVTADSAVLSFFKQLKTLISNGTSTHATPVQAEIYANADSYAAALNATTKFTIPVATPYIVLKRDALDTITASGNTQTVWNMTVAGGLAALPNHGTILATEIGVASVLVVEKSLLGDWTDTVVLQETTDYTVDYSTRTATKITLASGTGIVSGISKIRISWIADVMKIDGATNNTALKVKIYLNRTNSGETSPDIEPISLGSGKYLELLYGV